MTTPKWIEEAIEDARVTLPKFGVRFLDADRVPGALLERLPIEAMVRAAAFCDDANTDIPAVLRVDAARRIVMDAVSVLISDGGDGVVTLTQLYQDSCRALDVAGVPYANDDEVPKHLDLPARIRWLAMQRPTRLELQRVEAERDEARRELAKFREQTDLSKYTGW